MLLNPTTQELQPNTDYDFNGPGSASLRSQLGCEPSLLLSDRPGRCNTNKRARPTTSTLDPQHSTQRSHEPLSKLLVSPLIAPIVVPYIIPHITPFKEFRLQLTWLRVFHLPALLFKARALRHFLAAQRHVLPGRFRV